MARRRQRGLHRPNARDPIKQRGRSGARTFKFVRLVSELTNRKKRSQRVCPAHPHFRPKVGRLDNPLWVFRFFSCAQPPTPENGSAAALRTLREHLWLAMEAQFMNCSKNSARLLRLASLGVAG